MSLLRLILNQKCFLKLLEREIMTIWRFWVFTSGVYCVAGISELFPWSLKQSVRTSWRIKRTPLDGPTCKSEGNITRSKSLVLRGLWKHVCAEQGLLIGALASNTALGHGCHLTTPEWSSGNRCNTCECEGCGPTAATDGAVLTWLLSPPANAQRHIQIHPGVQAFTFRSNLQSPDEMQVQIT